MSISAGAIIALAEADVGRAEVGSTNRGPWLDPIQRRVSAAHGWAESFLLGQPWCGTWLWDIYERAGLSRANNPAHPSTETMWVRASGNGTLTGTPVPGAAIVWRGIHTGLVVGVDHRAGVVHTIEGNSSDAVRRRVRAISGTHRYIVPVGLIQGPAPAPTVTEHWLEDLRASYQVLGPWRVKAARDRQLAAMRPERRRIASPVTTGDGRYAIRVGQPRHYGPGSSPSWWANAQPVLERRLGRRLRRWSRTRPAASSPLPSGPAEALGRTT